MGIPYFDIAALPIFFLIFWTIILRKMTKGRCNILYLFVIILSIIADVSEIIEKLILYYNAPLNHGQINAVRICNYLYYISRNAVNLSYVFFIIAMTRTWYRIKPLWKKLLISLPYIGILTALIYNIPTSYVFTVTANEGYQRGPGVAFTYSFAALHMVFGVYYLIRFRKTIDFGTWGALMSLYVCNFIAVMVQMLVWGLQVESFATALTLIFVIIFVQRPEKKVDLNTGLPGYPSFCEEIGKIKATGHDVKILIITMKNALEMKRYLGEKVYFDYVYSIEELIGAYARKEKVVHELYFEQPGIFYIILENTDYNPIQAISELRERVKQHNADIVKKGATPDLSVVTVTFPEEISTPEELFAFGHNYVRFSSIDKKFTRASAIISQKNYQIEANIVDILDKAMEKGTLKVDFKPVWSTALKRYICAETRVELMDETYGEIDSELLDYAADEKGMALILGDYILDKAFSYATESNLSLFGYSYVVIGLAPSLCMQVSLTDRIWDMREKYGVHPEQVCFLIKESAYENMSTVFEENIKKLSMQGYRIGLDGFGKGYTNIRNIFRLPIETVRLDKDMILMTSDEKGKAMLEGCIRMLKNVPLEVIMGGADDEETMNMLAEMGCELIQGEYVPQA
ncbi:MAG: EAL domain-containing protein [Lachnospiraceae bacterium]|nr:EAL domain-containing protein [Lachnospiraceae bacterium]